MDNTNEKNMNDYRSCLGSVKIADDVVGMIAALATTEVEGVYGMAKNLNKGVKVDVQGKSVKASVSIIMEYGYNIPSTCQKVQDKVKSSVENMTGLTVADVDVRISGINVPNTK